MRWDDAGLARWVVRCSSLYVRDVWGMLAGLPLLGLEKER